MADLRQSYGNSVLVGKDRDGTLSICIRPDVYINVRTRMEDRNEDAGPALLAETGLEIEPMRARLAKKNKPFEMLMTKLPKRGDRQ